MTSLLPAKKSFFLPKKVERTDDAETTKGEGQRRMTSAARWTEFMQRPFSDRELRRLRERDTKSTTKKHRRHQLATFHQRRQYGEIVAVTVLRDLEGGDTGATRLRLIEDGKLSPTQAKIVGWIDTVIDGEDAKRPVTVQVPRGHTPREILNAAGIDDDAIFERYTDLVEQQRAETELRRAEKRQAAQAKREAAVTA